MQNCDDDEFDLCMDCEKQGSHLKHIMIRISEARSTEFRNNTEIEFAVSLAPFAIVGIGKCV
jgi:hypothetical protein